jgi:transposase InsO family protein
MNRWQGAVVPRKLGRPPHSQETLDNARPRVLEVLLTIGYQAGWPTVKEQLQDVPTRVIQMLLRVLKAEHASDMAQQARIQREHVEYLAQGVLVGQDSTHVGGCEGEKVWAEVQKDAATLEGKALGDGKPVTADKVIAMLEAMEKAGTLPLAYGTDNGKGYTALRVKAWLESRQVIHLLSRPHTPQDNGRTERAIGEGKALARLGKGVLLETPGLGVQLL